MAKNISLPRHQNSVLSKQQQRERISADLRAFLAKGGSIIVLPSAASREALTRRKIEILKGIVQEQ